jgi:hypothetical protein
LTSPDHAGQHTDANDAIESLQAKVGINGSAVTSSLDYKIANIPATSITSGTLNNSRLPAAATNITSVGTLSALTVTNATTSGSFIQGTDYLSPYQGFRNAIINGDFRINQRIFTSSTTSLTYGFDRWFLETLGGTTTMSAQTFTVGSPAATGFESANFCRMVTSGQSGVNDYSILEQRIEDVRTFANSTVTVSFWAKAASGTPKMSVEFMQNFGTGGSASVFTYVGQPTLSTSWARFSVTVTLPNINGKTIGTSPYLQLALWCSGGSTYNSRINTLGLQSNTFDIWGVQVERGSVATPFEQRPISTELALCQRYYEKSYAQATSIGTITSAGAAGTCAFTTTSGKTFMPVNMKVTKRATPTVTVYSSADGSSGSMFEIGFGNRSAAAGNLNDTSFVIYNTVVLATALDEVQAHWVASAEL